MSERNQTEDQSAKRKAAVAKLRAAYRAGKLTDAQIKRAESLGIEFDTGHNLKPGVNDLATVSPKVAAEWHPTKNGDLKPTDVTAGSSKKVWWLCRRGHEWEAIIVARAKRGSSCNSSLTPERWAFGHAPT